MVNAVMTVILLAGSFWAGFFPIRGSNDDWWHIKTGQVLCEYFAQHGFTFPPYDVFTYTGANTPWVNHEWLAQVILYSVYALGGLQAAILLKSLVLMATYTLLAIYIRRLGAEWSIACAASIAALLSAQGTLFLRPPVFTYLFIVLFFHILLGFQQKKHLKWWIAAAVTAEIVWINLHGGAIIGVILFFFWWIDEAWSVFSAWSKRDAGRPGRLTFATLAFFAVFAASFVNPFTYHIHLLPFHVTGDPWLVNNIGEMQPPNLQIHPPFMWFLLAMLAAPFLRTKPVSIFGGLTALFFALQALSHTRHVPLFAMAAAPPVAVILSDARSRLLESLASDSDSGVIRRSLYGALRSGADALIVCLVFSWSYGMEPGLIWRRNIDDIGVLFSTGYEKKAYPAGAVNFIERHELPGPMFNHDNFAGYLIYRLAPEKYKLFTDSRYDLWGSRYAKEEMAVYGAHPWPMGAYSVNGYWVPVKDIRKRTDFETKPEWRPLLNPDEFPEFAAWYKSGKPYWEWVLDQYKANFIISYEGYPIDQVLKGDFYGWFLLYDRQGYVIYLRDSAANKPLNQELAILHRDHLQNDPMY